MNSLLKDAQKAGQRVGLKSDEITITGGNPLKGRIAVRAAIAPAAFLGRETIAPEVLRRNFVTRSINLAALKGQRFRIGTAVLEGTGDCAPCSWMEEALGPGGYNAMRGHGGITARIIEGGEVHLGDEIARVDP